MSAERPPVPEGADYRYRIERLPPYLLGNVCEAVLAARREGRDVVDLSQFNPEAAPPAAAVDRLVQSILRPENHRYSASRGIRILRRAIADWYGRRFNVSLDPENETVVTLGTKEGLNHLFLATLTPGESVLLPAPAYPIHSAALFLAGALRIGVSLFPQEFDDKMERKLTEEDEDLFRTLEHAVEHTSPKPRAILCSFPHNPTATIVTEGFFERLVEFAREHEMFIVHDFAYGDFTFDGYRAPSVLQVRGGSDVAVEFYSLSKIFCVPGWRMSFCVGNARLISALKRLKSYVDSGAFQPIQIAAAELLAAGESRVREVSAMYQHRRDVLISGLREIGWRVPSPPRATPFLWTQLPDALRLEGGVTVCARLLAEANVAVCPGVCFDREAESYLRFSLVERESRLRLAVKRIGGVLPAECQ